MVSITKSEAMAVRKRFPHLHLRRTVNKYFVEESKAVLDFLKNLGVKKENA